LANQQGFRFSYVARSGTIRFLQQSVASHPFAIRQQFGCSGVLWRNTRNPLRHRISEPMNKFKRPVVLMLSLRRRVPPQARRSIAALSLENAAHEQRIRCLPTKQIVYSLGTDSQEVLLRAFSQHHSGRMKRAMPLPMGMYDPGMGYYLWVTSFQRSGALCPQRRPFVEFPQSRDATKLRLLGAL